MALRNCAKWVLPFILLETSHVLAKDLVPIRPNGGRFGRRQDASAMDLQNSETFMWGDGNAAVASLKVDMPGENENILSMEKFDGMLTAVSCSNGSISMTFKDEATFAYAQRTWDWVNGADNHSFVMVAGPGDCGNNTNRTPYTISTMQYDETANKATLAAKEEEWSDIAHTYELVVGSVAQAGDSVEKRDIEKSSAIDFNHDMKGSFAIGVGKLEARLLCLNCSTFGQFDMQFTISQKLGFPTGASMKLSPKGVSAIAQIKLSGSGDLTDALTKTFDILSIPIDGVKIPGVLDLGPFLTVAIGAQILPITLTAGITSGATGNLSDNAILEIDLLNPEDNKFSGWEPNVDIIDVTVDGSISGGVAVFMQAAMEIKFIALKKGFSVGVKLKLPNINAKLTAIASSGQACPPSDGNIGVKIGTNIGAALTFEALKNDDDAKPLFTVQLATLDKPVAQICFPINGGPPVSSGALLPPRWVGHPHVPRLIEAA